MQSSRGDVVLVRFMFSEGTGAKLRPALVVSAAAYHRGRQEVVVAAITSNVGRRLFGDHEIVEWKAAGLLFPSMVTAILRTIKRSMIDRKVGSLGKPDMDGVTKEIRRSLGL